MAPWLAGLLLAAPEATAAELLKVAWASQYEWREDKVASATLAFRYKVKRRWGRGGEVAYEGRAEVVVVGDAVVRRHYAGTTEDRRREVDGHLDWVLGRFLRKPFDREFEGVPVTGPEPAPPDRVKVTAGPRAFWLRGGRLDGVAVELFQDPRTSRPYVARYDYRVEEARGGYMVVAESYDTTYEGERRESSRTLTLAAAGDVPVPATYAHRERQPGGVEADVELAFEPAALNLPDPVVLSAEARDLLKAAWSRRVTLPDGLVVTADFVRSADPAAGRWTTRRVVGSMRYTMPDAAEAQIDEQKTGVSEPDRLARLRETVEGDLRWAFGLLAERPFEEEFAGCGFQLAPAGKGTVVAVLGHAEVLAFRLADGRVAAHRENAPGEEAWWEHKARKQADGRWLLESLVRKVEGEAHAQALEYARLRGHAVPRAFGRFFSEVGPRGRVAGVDAYELKRLKVEPPA